MAAIISGNGLGLFNTSLNQLGGALGGRPGLGQSAASQYVNIATGNLVMQGNDEQLLARGLMVSQNRTYNSRGALTSVSAAGKDCWTFGFETTVALSFGSLNVAGSKVTRTLGDGTVVLFDYDAQAGVYRSTAGEGAHDRIAYDASNRTWVWTEGSSLRQEIHDSNKGLLISIRDLKTGAENTLERNSSGRLERVVTQNGDAMLFGYDGSTSKLLSLSTLESGTTYSQVRYGYDRSGRLARIDVDLTPGTWADNASDASLSFTTSYEYADDTPKIKRAGRSMSQSDGLEVSYEYYVDGPNRDKIRSVTVGSADDGSAQTMAFAYDDANRTTHVTDLSGRTWSYKYDAAGQLIEVLSPAEDGIRQLTRYEYSGAGDLLRVIDAEGRTTASQYDAQGNLTLQRDHAGNTVRRTYDANNQLLSEAVYTSADSDGAGPMQPSGALVTRYVRDEHSRVAYAVDPQGEVTHFQYDSLTGQVSSILKFHSDRYLVTGLDEQQAPSRQNMADWMSQVYATARAAGQSAPVARTDVSYDPRGLEARRTVYARVDAGGLGVLDAEAEVTERIHDAQGLVRQEITYRGVGRGLAEIVSHTYDGMGRLLDSVDASGNATHWVYDDAGQRLIVTQANGLVRTEARDKSGRTIAVTESASGVPASARTTQRYFDRVGQLRASEDATGARTYFFYDAVGRLTGEVDVTGAVTEYRNDKTGRLLQTIRYANRVDTRAWLAAGMVQPEKLAGIRPAVDAADRATAHAYDAAGRRLSDTDAEGTVTLYAYDGAARLLRVSTSRPGDAAEVTRQTRLFYDDSGCKVAELDAEGHLTEHRFDAAGRQITVIRYARETSESQRDEGTLADLRPLADAADQTTRSFYNGRHLLRGQLNAEGYFTEFVYDEANNQRAVRVYNQRLAGLAGDESFDTLRTRVQADGARETRRMFDARGLLDVELNAEGTATKFHYNATGRLIRTEAAQNTTELRNGHQRYDVFGNVIGELVGEAAERAKLLVGGKELNDPTLTAGQLDLVYSAYGVRYSYDALNRRIESIDSEGNKSWYFHDTAGRSTHTVRGVADDNGVRNASGEVIETRYDTFGQVIETTAYTGRIAIGSPFGRAQVDAAIRVLQYIAGHDSRNSFEYDRRGLLTARADAEGFRTWRTYNAFGNIASETREIDAQRSVSSEYTYDRLGWLQSSIEDAAGLRRSLAQTWDAFGRITSTTDGRNSTTFHGFDRLGRQVTQHRDVAGRSEEWTTSYDAHGRVVTQTDPLGQATHYTFDDVTRSVVVITPEQVTLRTERNEHGEIVRVVDAHLEETSYAYNLDGKLIATTAADDQTTSQLFDTRGLLSRTTDATGRAVAYHYDAVGRVLERIEDPDGLALTTRHAYDGQGRQVLTTDALGDRTRVLYDGNGQLEEVIRDEGGLNLRTTYTWDGLGRQLSVTEAAGTTVARAALYQYDNLGRRISEVQSAGVLDLVTRYEYDGNDNLVRRIDAEQRVSRYVYDDADRLALAVAADGGVTRIWYDLAGRQVATRRYAHAIDLAGLADAPGVIDIETRLQADDTRDVQQFRALDRDGRVRLEIDGSGGVTAMDYDDASRLVATTHHANRLDLDSALRAQLIAGAMDVTALARPAASAQDVIAHRIHDAVGRLRYSVDAMGNVQQLDYDAAGRNVGSRRYATPIRLDDALLTKFATKTTTIRDIADRIVVDAVHDLRNYQVMDSAGRVRYSIDGLGNVQEYFVDAAGRSIGSRRFATSMRVDALLANKLAHGSAAPDDVTGALVADDTHDLRNYQVLDSLGRVRYSVDAAGSVREFQFDATGNLLGSRHYASTITLDPALLGRLHDGTATLSDIADLPGLHADNARDARSLQLLDAAGRVRFVVDAAGFAQESRYDATGMVVQQLAYATALSATDMAAIAVGTLRTADLATRLAPHQADARATTLVHDQTGRLRYALTRDGAATATVQERRFDGAGQLIAEISYASSVALDSLPTEAGIAAAISTAGLDAPSQQRQTRHVHDSAGRLRYSIDNAGTVTEQRFDGAGRVVESRSYGQRLPAGTVATQAAIAVALAGSTDVRVTRTGYDAAGRVLTVTDALGHAESFAYNGAGQKISYTNRDQHTWRYGYDAAGQLTEETSPPVNVSWFDAAGSLRSAVREIATHIAYDALGNVVARTENAGTEQARTTEYRYDSRGNQVATVFPDAGRFDAATLQLLTTGTHPTTTVAYDALGRAVVQKDVLDNHSYRVYDTLGQLRYEVDQQGYVTGYRYDAYGAQTELTRYANAVSVASGQAVALNALEGQLQLAPAADRTLSMRYDLQGQKVEVLQGAVAYYDGAGNLLHGRPATRFDYDAYGQLARESVLLTGDPDAASARWADTFRYYDAVGRNTLTVDAEGYVTALDYSAQGEVLKQVEYARALVGTPSNGVRPPAPPAGDALSGFDRTTSFVYDALGRKVSESALRHEKNSDGVASDRDVHTQIEYDNEGHALTTSVDDVATTTAYDALGRVTSVLESERDVLRTDADSLLTNAGIDLTSAGLYERSSPYSEMFYDAFGNNVKVQRYAGGQRAGQIGAQAAAGDLVHLTRYDYQGRSVWERDAVGTSYVRTYDAADHLLETRYRLAGNEGRSAAVVTTAQYDRLGRQTTSSVRREIHQGAKPLLSNGVAVVEVDAQSTVRYDAFGEIVAKDDRIVGAFAGQFAQYDYDGAGRLIRSNAEGGTWRDYGYNLAGHQLRESHVVRLGSESGQNVVNVAVVTVSLTDRLGRAVESRLPSHTDNLSEHAIVTQRYDRWGNVVEVVDPRRGRTQYEYNELNQAVREIRPEVKVLHADGTEQRLRPENRWFHDAIGRLVGTRDGNGNIDRIEYDASGRVIVSRDANGKATRLAYDALGQQRLTQDALGTLTYRSFDAAGRIVAQGDYLTDAAGITRARQVRESYVLNQNGDRLRVTDGLGNSAIYDYDSRGLVLRSRTAGGVLMSYGYDSQGHKVRETNALSDPTLLTAMQPRYNGGLLGYQVVPVGQAFSYVVPADAFKVLTGELIVSASVQVFASDNQWQLSDALRFEHGVLSGTPAEGSYRIVLTATGSSGQIASTTIAVRVVSQAAFAADHANDPVATAGLYFQAPVRGELYTYALPPGLFVDPQGQPLTIVAGTREVKIRIIEDQEEPDERFVPLPLAPTSEQWLAFDPGTGIFSGIAPGTAPMSVIIRATDSDGRFTTLTLSIKSQPNGLNADGRRTVIDDDNANGTANLDEQTWDYDYFGRLTDHNDLSGADYDYAYDALTGQQFRQNSRWTDAAREYSTPLLDRWEDNDWNRYGLDPTLENLYLPPQDPVEINNPERTLSYYANGQLKQIREGRNWTQYAYDAAGNRTMEETLTHDANGQVLRLRTSVSYDAHNRIAKVTQDDVGANLRLLELRYDYDAVGNRRRVLARGAYDGAQVIGFDNLPPVVNQAIAPQHVVLGEAWSFKVPAQTFRDPEDGPLRIEAAMADGSAMPAWLTYDRATRTFRGTPTQDTNLTLRLTAFDLDDLSVSSDFVLTASANQAPVAGTIADQGATIGRPWTLATAGTFSDPDGRPLGFSATLDDGSALPAWLGFDRQSGVFSGTASAADTLRITVVATDSAGASVAVAFNLSVTMDLQPFNPDFELGDTGWIKEGTGWTIEGGGGAYSGAWKAVDRGIGTTRIVNANRVPVSAGQALEVRAFYHQGSADAHDNQGAVLIVWYDAAGNEIGSSEGNRVVSSDGGFQPSGVIGYAPSNARFAAIGAISIKRDWDAIRFDNFTWSYTGAVGGGEPPPPPADVENLDFELGNTGWVGNGISIVQEPGAHTGGWVARRDYTGGATAGIRAVHAIAVTAGQSVTATAMMQAYGAGDQVGGQVRILWLDANRQQIGDAGGNEINVTNGQGWRPSTVTAVAPNGAAFLVLQGDSFALQPGGVVLFDSFTVSVAGGGTIDPAPFVANAPPPLRILIGFHPEAGGGTPLPADTFVDPEGGDLSLQMSALDGEVLPSWLRMDGGLFWIDSIDAIAPATLTVRVTATDEQNLSVSTEVTLNLVAGEPLQVAAPIPAQVAYTGFAWRFQIPAGTFVDPEGAGIYQFTADVADGSPVPESGSGNRLPAWLAFDSWSRTFYGMPPDTTALRLRVNAYGTGERQVSTEFTLTPVVIDQPINLDFELGDTGWTGTGMSIVQQVGAHSGGWVAKREYTSGAAASVRAAGAIAVTAGQSVTATAMMQAYGAGDQVGGQVRIIWLDANRQQIGHVAGNEINVTNGQGWRLSTITAVAPNGAAFMTLQGDSFALQPGGVVLFDSFTVSGAGIENVPPVPTDTDNLGFELGDTGWDKGNGWNINPASGGDAFYGGWSARYTGLGNSSISNQRLMPIEAGASYTASVMVSSRNGSAAELILEWHDANGQLISYIKGNLVKDGGWGRSSVTGMPPTGATFLRIGCSAQNDVGEGPVILDSFELVRNAVGGGGGGGGGGGEIEPPIQAQFMQQTQSMSMQTMPQALMVSEYPEIGDEWDEGGWIDRDPTDPYNAPETWKSYWYSYDAENRVSVTNGQLVDGEIVLGSADISYALDYDDGGRATRRRFLQAGTQRVEVTAYDQRGQRTAVFQAYAYGTAEAEPAAWAETLRYDAVGRTTQRRAYFGAGDSRNDVAIGGWLKHAETFSYDADGRLLRQDVQGRALGWVAYAPLPPPTPPTPVFTSSGPGAPTIGVAPWAPAGEFERGTAGEFSLDAGTFVDADGPLRFEQTAGPAWLNYSTQADGSHRFEGTPPDGASSGIRTVTLKATDALGNWTTLDIQFAIAAYEEPTPPGTQPLMMAKASAASASGDIATVSGNPEIDDVGRLTNLSAVDYSRYGYDAAGRSRGYEYHYWQHEEGSGAKAADPKGYTHSFVIQYEARESYLETQVHGRSNALNTNFRASSTASSYDAWGRRTAVRETTVLPGNLGTIPDRIRYFSFDAEGNILRRREGTFENNAFQQDAAQARLDQFYAYVGGQQVASGKRNGELDVVGRLTAYASSEAGSITVTVQAGDTLRAIAQRVYGNGNLWYVLAEANATSDELLAAGTTLRVPEVKVTANDATTFKPYNPAEAIGNTAPSLPYITPPPKQSCNMLAVILIIIVVIVVTVFTAGAAAGPAASAAAAAAGTTATTGVMATGALALSGGAGLSVGASIAVGAAAGAAGALAGQALGSVMGVSSFSWRNVAAGAVTGALTAGLASQFGSVGAALKAGDYAKTAALAAGYASTGYVGNKLAGVQGTTFSWKAIAAGAVSNVITPGVGIGLEKLGAEPGFGQLGQGRFGGNLLQNMAGGVVSLHTRRAFGFDDKVDYGMIAADAFGNALGNAAVRGIASARTSRLMQGWAEEDALQRQQMIAQEELAYANQRIAALDGEEAALLGLGGVASGRVVVARGTSTDGFPGGNVRSDQVLLPDIVLRQGGRPGPVVDNGPVTVEALSDDYPRTWIGSQRVMTPELQELYRRDQIKYYAERFSRGVVNTVAEPVRMVGDLGKVIYSVAMTEATGQLQEVRMSSAMGKAAEGGTTTGELLHELNPVYGLLVAQHEIRQAIGAGDWGAVSEAGGGLIAGLALTRRGGGARAFGAVVDVAEESATLRRIADLNATPEAQTLHARINARDVANTVPGAVIGRMPDLRAPSALRPGEYTIADKLPNLGSPKANYYQNMSVLREEVRRGVPIRDASSFRPDIELAPTPLWPERTIRQTFTGAERNLLRNKGWTFDGEYWNPPR